MTATLLPNAKAQFIDSNGKPLAGGSVYFYIPNTSTLKNTYQDAAQTILNTNPIVLDASGQAIIWGTGTYRQVVYDQLGNLIWDQITEDSNSGLTGNLTDDVFVSGTDFTPGTTEQLTLTVNPGSIFNTWIFFDGTYQADDQIASLNGVTLTFASPIPVGVSKVTVKIGTTVAIGIPGNGTVGPNQLAYILSGPTSSRPKAPLFVGQPYFDTTIGQQIAAKNLIAPIKWVVGDGTPPQSCIPNILQYGGDPTGATDNAAAFAAAIAASPASQPSVYFPPGKYLFSSAISFTTPNNTCSVCIFGAGPDATELTFPSSNGLSVSISTFQNSFHIRDLTISTAQTNAGTALQCNLVTDNPGPGFNAVCDITNIVVRGADGYAMTQHWANGIILSGISNCNITNSNIIGYIGSDGYAHDGTGVLLGGGSPTHAVAINFIGCFINYFGSCVQMNPGLEGVTFVNCNMIGGERGVYVPATGLSNAFTQLTITGCSFGCQLLNIFQVTAIPGTIISDNFFALGNNTSGIALSQVWLATITGNSFEGAPAVTATAVSLGGTAPFGAAALITGNSFDGCGIGVLLQSGSGGNNVQSNLYHSCTTNVSNLGTGNVIGGGSQ